jgi:hypothetical protein
MIQQNVTGDNQIKVFHGQIAHKNSLWINELLHSFWEFTNAHFSAMTMNDVGFCKFTIATSLKH